MRNENPISVIASFSVLKTLNDLKQYKNQYQLLANFIEFIVWNDYFFSFTLSEMKLKLQIHFGFNIPEAVVKTSIKNLPYITRANKAYTVDRTVKPDRKQFTMAKNDAESKYGEIVDSIVRFVKNAHPEANQDEIIQAIVSYLVKDTREVAYQDAISSFIILKENDKDLQTFLNTVREGGILYLGLNYNIAARSSLQHPLTLYLDTEILFDLVGFNGSVYKDLAADFYRLVQKGQGKGKINLRYFRDVKLEIESFFKSAERIVEGLAPLVGIKPAMKMIVNGCSTSADVKVKFSDFFDKLQKLGIFEEEDRDYYSESLTKYNLEDIDNSDDRDEGWKAISHINKLRHGRISDFDLDSSFLIVTNTSSVLSASNSQCEIDKKTHARSEVANYAVSLNRIICLLWYKLDGGFGGEKYPVNALVLLRARTVLSSSIAKQASQLFQDNWDQYTRGEIDQEQLAARILVLRGKPTLPEEVKSDNFEQALDFSPEAISRLEIELQSRRQHDEEQDKLVHAIQATHQKIVSDQKKELDEKDRIIETQSNELEILRQKERRRDEIFRCWKTAFCCVVIVIIWSFACYLMKKHDTLNAWVNIIVNSAGLGSLCLVFRKKIMGLFRKSGH